MVLQSIILNNAFNLTYNQLFIKLISLIIITLIAVYAINIIREVFIKKEALTKELSLSLFLRILKIIFITGGIGFASLFVIFSLINFLNHPQAEWNFLIFSAVLFIIAIGVGQAIKIIDK